MPVTWPGLTDSIIQPHTHARTWSEPTPIDSWARPAWHQYAACRGRTDWWQIPPPGTGHRPTAAHQAAVDDRKAVCARCPVVVECARQHADTTVHALPAGVIAGIGIAGHDKARRASHRQIAAIAHQEMSA